MLRWRRLDADARLRVALRGVRCAGGARLLHGEHGAAREARARCAAPAPPGGSGALRRASLACALTTRTVAALRSFKLGVRPELLRVLPMDTPVTVEGGVQARAQKRGKTRVCRCADC